MVYPWGFLLFFFLFRLVFDDEHITPLLWHGLSLVFCCSFCCLGLSLMMDIGHITPLLWHGLSLFFLLFRLVFAAEHITAILLYVL